MASLSL